ncbi:hypothetical protein E2C01_052535 [Portunus trituberculatus]|uniref:Uncharacterized protein n=1 Tax=Portunus trituberculatus TaxID=210409 RepID=A0A5B7GLS8_PORTR|nr:hypothetical protein [Portunus trituberculatus]
MQVCYKEERLANLKNEATRRDPTNLGESLEFLSGTRTISESPPFVVAGEERLCCYEIMSAYESRRGNP